MLSRSPLSRPDRAIHQLAAEVQDYLYFPDPSPLYVTLSAVAANMICGWPVWLMLVGPPSSGKTVLLMSLTSIPGVHMAEDISGPQALLSATGKKDIERSATGGLLRQVGPRGCIIMEDFTSSVMGLDKVTRSKILTAFRLAYKGRWSREVGAGGGKSIVWEGKLAALAGGTMAVDRLTTETSELGERWIYYRFPRSTGWGESKTSLQNQTPQESAALMKGAVKAFFEILDLRWPCWMEGNFKCKLQHEHYPERVKREFSLAEYARLIAMATLVSRARSGVYRHPYTRIIEDIPTPESPTRLANALGQLYLGMEAIELTEKERWPLISKVALDSVQELRAKILVEVWKGYVKGVDVGVGELEEVTGVAKATALRSAQDLMVHGILKTDKDTGKLRYLLTDYAEAELTSNFVIQL